jgi:hypothetical protein
VRPKKVLLKIFAGLFPLYCLSTTFADQVFDFSTRYHYYTNLPGIVDESVFYKTDITPWLRTDFGLRFGEGLLYFDSFDYKVDFTIQYFNILETTVRLSEINSLIDQTGTTTLFIIESLRLEPFTDTGMFASFGWYQRYTTLSGAPIFPGFSGQGLVDCDFLAQIGFKFKLPANFYTSVRLANFESIDVFNLNNPFAEVRVDYQKSPESWKWSLWSRYRVLLGFGQLNELMFAAGVSIPLTDIFPKKNVPTSPNLLNAVDKKL